MASTGDVPFAPRKWPFFYGWVIVAMSTLGILASIPGQTIGVSAFTDHLLRDLGLTRVQLSVAYMIGTVCSSFLLTAGGRSVDRYGVRSIAVAASIFLALSLLLTAGSGAGARAADRAFGEEFHFVFAFGLISLSFLSIRFFGQGMLTMVSRVMLGKWFERRRGLATGLSGVFISFGYGTAPLGLSLLIGSYGWRTVYVGLACVLVFGVSVLASIFFRERPEDCGLVKDGKVFEESLSGRRGAVHYATRDFTLEEARRSYAFWVFTLGLACQGLVITAITFHIASISVSAGLEEAQGFALFLPMALVNVVSNLVSGWISDKTKLKYLLIVMMAAQATGTTGILFLAQPWGPAMAVAGFGVSGGMFPALVGVTWPRFYGLLHLGAISGFNMSIMVFGTAFGPYIFGASYEWSGSYSTGLKACMALPLLVLVAAFKADNPQETGK